MIMPGPGKDVGWRGDPETGLRLEDHWERYAWVLPGSGSRLGFS